jgi:hypothetical protein
MDRIASRPLGWRSGAESYTRQPPRWLNSGRDNGSISGRDRQEEVEVIAQDDEPDQGPAGPDHGPLEVEEEPASIVVIMDDVLACVAAGHDMVDRVFEFDAEAAWHA